MIYSRVVMLRPFVALTGLCLCALLSAHAAPALTLGGQRVEQRVAPVGLDTPTPRFSWQLQGSTPGLRQTAYQVQVALSPNDFDAPGKKLAWDSGWIASDQSHLVAYAGEALRSSTAYFWRVRIKNESATPSAWSEPARWVTGLLDPATEFTASWIGYDEPDPQTPHGTDWFELNNAEWICHPAIKPRKDSLATYRTTVTLPADVRRVMVGMECNFTGQLALNGIELLQGGRMDLPSYLDVTPWVQPGANALTVRVDECTHTTHSGLLVALRIEHADGKISRAFSDGHWEAALAPDGAWQPVKVLGKPGAPNQTGQGKGPLEKPAFGSHVFSPPAVYLRREIELTQPVRFAVFHGTAQGLYDLHVNGRLLTPAGFQPGWTQFEKRTAYVSTDVTAALVPGRNTLGAVLADGWFRGHLLWFGRERFGDKLRFAGRLDVEYADGSRASFLTGPTWQASYGPIRQSDIMNGEIYDARLEQPGWNRTGFDARAWHPVVVSEPQLKGFALRAYPTDPVRPEAELPPRALTEPKPGVHVVDFGQNFAGWTRLKVKGRAGQTVYLRFGEDLNPDGTVYTANLRGVNPADRYICRGGAEETWEPRFTYHGFRYVEIIGLTEKPTADTLTGIVAHSGGPITSTFDSSSPMLNRLYQNVQWSQRSNYFETMTDCPQRDERYGWVGDAHFFLASSAYNQNGASFFTKWFEDCVDTQKANTGNISNGAPGNKPGAGNAQLDWSAAMMITPWTIWQRYGDARPILTYYPQLRHYMTQWEKLIDQLTDNPAVGKKDASYRIIGDWVSLEKGTTREFIGRVMGYQLSQQMVDCARLAGNTADEATFTRLAARYREEILRLHLKPDGKVTGDTQCAYAYLTRLGLYEPAQAAAIREQFRRRMETDRFTVQTGFHGTGHLLPGLSAMGLDDLAARTLLNEAGPGWGAMVRRGATTIWERWESKDDAGKYFAPQMNSFNHYTFGGCGEWMMGYLVGLRPAEPGFKLVRVEPVIAPGLTHAAGRFETPYGPISNRWERQAGRITMHLRIPPNSGARVILPATAQQLTHQGQSAEAPAIDGRPTLTVESGDHVFTWTE